MSVSLHRNFGTVFGKKYLCDLYEKGKADDKKHRFQPEIVRKYRHCINLMRHVPDTIALAKYKGLNLENLKGDKAGISSIRVNRQYRIAFTVTDNGVESVATVCNIIELSNHYQ
jgi:proteic killer suppression protein